MYSGIETEVEVDQVWTNYKLDKYHCHLAIIKDSQYSKTPIMRINGDRDSDNWTANDRTPI